MKLEPAVHRRGRRSLFASSGVQQSTGIAGELFDFASTIHDKSAVGAQGNAIFDIKVFEFCQTVLKFLRFNVSSRALYAQMSRPGSDLVISRAFKVGKSAQIIFGTGKL